MREAVRRPTRDGVLDTEAENSLSLPWFSASILCRNSFSYPSIILLRAPAHSAAPRPLYQLRPPVWRPKSHPKFQSIFDGLLTPKILQKVKIDKKCIVFPGVFSYSFSSILEAFLFAFLGARLSISLAWPMNSWGAPFFAKSEEVAKMTSKSH